MCMLYSFFLVFSWSLKLTRDITYGNLSSVFMLLAAKFPTQSMSSDKEDIEMTCSEDIGESSLNMVSSLCNPQGDKIVIQESKADCETNIDMAHSNSSGERRYSSECSLQDEVSSSCCSKSKQDSVFINFVMIQANETKGNAESTVEYPTTPMKREEVIRRGKKKKTNADPMVWKRLRQIYSDTGPRPLRQMDSADWEAVRRANYIDVAKCIKLRGQHNVLAVRIQVWYLNKFRFSFSKKYCYMIMGSLFL